jgi:hypothetical protein
LSTARMKSKNLILERVAVCSKFARLVTSKFFFHCCW